MRLFGIRLGPLCVGVERHHGERIGEWQQRGAPQAIDRVEVAAAGAGYRYEFSQNEGRLRRKKYIRRNYKDTLSVNASLLENVSLRV